jgi:Lon protease-like protein
VLFPGGLVPLVVFEERYRQLVRERRDFAVVLLRSGSEVGAGRGEDFHDVGTMGTMQRIEALEDGRFSVVVRGLHRVRVRELERGQSYLMGRVERLPEPPQQAGPRLVSLFERYLALHGISTGPELASELARRPIWLVGSALQIEPARRQLLLESADPTLAEALLDAELAKQNALGRLGPFSPRPPSPN